MTEPKLGWGLNYLATSTTQLSNRSHLKCFVTATKYLHLAYVSSSLSKVSVTIVRGYWFLVNESSRIRTRSPFWNCLPSQSVNHFWRICKLCIYSVCHLCQNWSAKYCTCFQELLRASLVPITGMSNCEVCTVFWWINISGESTCGVSGSVDTATSGLALRIALTSIKNVVKTSCVKGPLWLKSKLSCIFLETPIILSHAPPKWEAWGGLNTHLILFSSRYLFDAGFSTSSEGMFSSCTAPMKFVPRSDQKSETV